MVYDVENKFFDEVAGTQFGTTAKNSDIVVNGEGGQAVDPLNLVVTASAPIGTVLTVVLQTADVEAFTGAVDLGTYTTVSGAKGILVKAKVPYGAKKYLRLKVTGAAAVTGTAKVNAGLVADVDLK